MMEKKQWPEFIPLYEILQDQIITWAQKYASVDLEHPVAVNDLTNRITNLMQEFDPKNKNYESDFKNILIKWSIFNNKINDSFEVKKIKSLNHLEELLQKHFTLEVIL